MPARTSRKITALLEMLDGRSLVFLGMMGCGKSAIGKMVANRLGMEFRDSDAEIEAAAGRSVAEIFEEYGEEEFRRLEGKVIERLLSGDPIVLALGGGAFMSEETRACIGRNGISIWLKAGLDLLLLRVMRRPGKRPLLSRGDPRSILADLLAKREPVYALADLHVVSTGGTKSQTRDLVIQHMAKWLADHTEAHRDERRESRNA